MHQCLQWIKDMIEQLRQRLLALQKMPGIEDRPGILPLGIPSIDTLLGGGFVRGALHEIVAAGEAHLPAAAGFALGLAKRSTASPRLLWISEDLALTENGAPHGAGLDVFGLVPEQLVMVSAVHRRELLWAMEEALRCRAVDATLGEMRDGKIDSVAVRRLSLAAAESGTLALLLRTEPPDGASTAATRWIVGAAPSIALDAPRFSAQLVRNRRGPTGSWILEWSNSDGQFIIATHAQPVAAPASDRSHRQVA
jgi:protein ImuA